MGDLTHRQQRFVDAYLGGAGGVRGNAIQAAITAGYSRRTAKEQGHDLLTKPHIQAQITAALTRSGLTRDRTLERRGVLAFAVLAEVATYDPVTGRLTLKPEALQHPALQEAEVDADGRCRVKLRDPTPHLDALSRFLGIDKPDPGSLVKRVTLVIVRPGEDRQQAIEAAWAKRLRPGGDELGKPVFGDNPG